MFPSPISNHSSSLSQQLRDLGCLNAVVSTPISPRQPHLPQTQITQKIKKKRSLPGNPDPEAEVIALSPKTLLATNRFVCEICNKGFQRDQNLQLHRRGHNLPWKLKQRSGNEARKRAYVCPEASCVHHHPSRALGDLTGIKKHYCRKHGEKKWKCDRCSKIYAVQSDWKAHSKTCGTREYRCDCGTLFSRKDSFITHRAFCDALAEESARISASAAAYPIHHRYTSPKTDPDPVPSPLFPFSSADPNPNPNLTSLHVKPETSFHFSTPLVPFQVPKPVTPSPFQALHVGTQLSAAPHMSATALLQKAATIGSTATQLNNVAQLGRAAVDSPELMGSLAAWQKNDRLTRDFLGLAGDVSGSCNGGGGVSVNVSINVGEMLTYAGGIELQQYEREREALVKPQQQQQQGFAFAGPAPETWRNYS